MRTSLPPAAVVASRRTSSGSASRKWKVVPPAIAMDGRGWWVRTKTGTPKGGLSPPPTFPVRIIAMGMQTEHGGPHDFGAQILEVTGGELIVNSGRPGAGLVSQNPASEGAGGHVGGGQSCPVGTERLLGCLVGRGGETVQRSEEHTSELQSRGHLVC